MKSRRQPQQDLATTQQRPGGVLPDQPVLAFGCGPARLGDELAQVAPGLQVVRQRHQPKTGLKRAAAGPISLCHRKLGPGQQLQTEFFRLGMRAHHARHRALVGEGQRRVTQGCRTRHQLFRVRGAASKAEVGQAMQLGVARHRRHHGKNATGNPVKYCLKNQYKQ